MIKNLNGIHETVVYQSQTPIQFYFNHASENYPPHWHLPFELIMPVENGYTVICNNLKYHLQESDIMLIFPGALHELIAPDSGSRIIFQAVLPFAMRKNMESLISILSPAIMITPESHPEIHPKIYDLILKIQEEYTASLPYYESQIYSLFFEILVLIGRNHANTASRNFSASGNKQNEYIQKFLSITEYINAHFAENLTLDQVASMAGFSKYHFTRLFRQYADTSFYKYLNHCRISHSQELLLNPELSIIEIAHQSGFSSISAFVRMFRLINNCTPSEFRALCISEHLDHTTISD